MGATANQPLAAREARPRDRREPGRRTARARPETILGRRDVAIVPWAAISVGGAMVALSTWLRGPAGDLDLPVLWGALAVSALTAGMTAMQDTRIGLRYRGALPVYLIGAAVLLGVLAADAFHDDGVGTVYFGLSVLLAAYLGLVLPPVWARRALALMLTVAIGLAVAKPTPGLDGVIPIALICAGWLIGRSGYFAHERAAEVAGALSRYDALTATLNRRGFRDQLERTLRQRIQPARPLALLILDLDGFKQVNDTRGHAAGDELLSWIGQVIPDHLPAEAEVGRLGGDEFAVLLPVTEARDATAIAGALRSAITARIGVSIGVATSESRAVNADDLLRVADAAMYACKREPAGGPRTLVANSVGHTGERRRRTRRGAGRVLSYAEIRASGRRPRSAIPGSLYSGAIALALLVTAVLAVFVVAAGMLGDGRGFYDQAMRLLGIPWILGMLVLAALTSRVTDLGGTRFRIIFTVATINFSVGVGTAMLTHGGLVAPIGMALFLKVMFDASTLPRRGALTSLGFAMGGWLLVVVLGPASALWVIPFHLGMFGASFALGSIGQRAYLDVTAHAMSLAHTDALTGLRNRVGFERDAHLALEGARDEGRQLAVLALDLDDFKAVNDTLGHAAGDRVLTEVSKALRGAFPEADIIGRLGGDEFALLLEVRDEDDARDRAQILEIAVAAATGASVGHATFPSQGADLATLMLVADQRSYAVKRQRRAEREPKAA